MEYKKKLIEVALPLEAINAESAREKSIRHGHPSTLHLWWARRPLAAARAVIWSSLVDDPSSHPEEFPTEEAQDKERLRLFSILERLIKWENSNNADVLAEAKAEIMKSTGSNPPALLDPFAGGGAIPLEAQRLGLKAYASDLNPVAVMINKAMIEIPPKFAGQPPVNPEAQNQINSEWKGTSGLAEDVRYYGEWIKRSAFEKIGHLYPKVKDEQGAEHTVIAWIWARTVKCPNPACGCEMPLFRSFSLSKKKGGEHHIVPTLNSDGSILYKVNSGIREDGTINRKGAKCIFCNSPVEYPYIREEGKKGNMGRRLVAVAAEGRNERLYLSPDSDQLAAAHVPKPSDCPDADLPNNPRDFKTPNYGMRTFASLFTNRQLITLTTFCDLISDAREQVRADGGSKDYANAVSVYLSFVIDKMADLGNALNRWEPNAQCPRQLFARQAIPMVWDFAESNPFSTSSGSWSVFLNNLMNSFQSGLFNFERDIDGSAIQADAQTYNNKMDVMVSTDPPYYDNIGYADLSDFFYLWLRRTLKSSYPDLFRTMLVPKTEELVATPYRFEGRFDKAKEFFEEGMLKTFLQINKNSRQDIPVTIYYAFKQSESENDGNIIQTASTGWETMLSAIIAADFSITGTWPMRTEMGSRAIGQNTNALSSSIVLVCRKRPVDALVCTRRDFINILKRELKPSLQKLQASNIAPVDLAQTSIGPGMGVYSRFSKVLEADGTPMSVRSALQIINQELDHFFTEQDGELDRDSRFCVDIYTQYAFNEMKFGEADVLARAKNTSVEKLASRGVLYAQKGVVRLLTREEIPEKTDRGIIWLLTQQLTHALEKDGVVGAAKIIEGIISSEPEQAKALAYRLFTIAERKGWASEAYAYNTLVIMWPDVQSKAAELQSQRKNLKQIDMFNN